MNLNKAIENAIANPDAFAKLSAGLRRKEAERRAKLTPEERAEEDRRREESRRAEEEYYLAMKDETVPYLEHQRDMDAQEQYYEMKVGELQEQLDELTDAALTKLQEQESELARVKKLKDNILLEKVRQDGKLITANYRNKLQLEKLQTQEAELKAALARIDALLDANLKAQDMRRKLDQLAAQVGDLPKGLKAAAKEGAKAGVEGTLPKVYAKAANMSDEELRNAAKPKTRSSGGGRKFEKDIGCKQAKAALKYADKHPDIGLRAACAYIIRTMKDGDFEKPYTIAQHLDTAVRRYCKRTSRPIPSKGRSGKWSAKS